MTSNTTYTPTDLFTAIHKGDILEVQTIVNHIGTDHIDSNGKAAVFLATELKEKEILDLLLNEGAEVNLQDPQKRQIERTAFLLAGSQGLDAMLEILIPFNPNVSIVNGYGGNALIPAAHHGHVSTVRLLLEKTAVDVNLINNLGWTALIEAVILSDGGVNHQNIIRILLEFGADKAIGDKDGMTALDHARKKGYDEIVKILEG